MALLAYDLSLDQNADSTSYSWTVLDKNRQPSDLTSAHARMMIRTMPADASPLVSITDTVSASGQLVLGGAAGTVGLTITKAATALLVAQAAGALTSTYRFDIFVDFPTSPSLMIVGGKVNVTLAVTH